MLLPIKSSKELATDLKHVLKFKECSTTSLGMPYMFIGFHAIVSHLA